MTTNVNDIFFRTRRTDPWKTIIHSNNYTEFINNYYWANVKISTSANTQTTPSVNTIFANNWFRSQGDTGWYNESYGGGIRMTDTKWIRTFGGKSFYCDSQISSQGFHHLNHDNNDAVLLAGGGYSQGVPVKYWSIETIIIYGPKQVSRTNRGGNYTFITKVEPRIDGSCALTLQFPSGYNNNNTIIWAMGHLNQSVSSERSNIYATIVQFSGSKYYLNLADDASLNNGSCKLYFMCF